MPILSEFDYSLLDDPVFREDSVREEIVVPLLRELGYSASPPHKIIRSRRLEHPYVYIGSTKKNISIIPDYLLQRDNTNAFILDAKSPKEKIASGKNVEQAYSYAIHKDVRVPIYALCNGRSLAIYHISHWPALLHIPISELDQHWGKILELIGTRAAWPEGIPPSFRPDFGLAVKQSGIGFVKGEKVTQIFLSVRVTLVAKVNDSIYSLSAICGTPEEGEFIATFDFAPEVYHQLLSVLTDERSDEVRDALSHQPYYFGVADGWIFELGVVAEVGDEVHTNENESYCPFIASKFIGPETLTYQSATEQPSDS